jgi:hypothetical protein
MNSPRRVRSAKPHGSAPETVTTTQCGVMRSHPPPGQSAGTRRLTVRSQSLAALLALCDSYLLPMIRRRRFAPASLCRVMAQAAWPSGAASLKHDSRHGQPPQAPAAVMPHAPTARRKPQPTHAARECPRCRPSAVAVIMLKSSSTAVSLRSARHPPPRSQHHHQPRPPLLKLRPAAAPASPRPQHPTASAPPPPASASSAAHRSLAEPRSLPRPLCLWTSCRGLRERVTRGGGVPAALASRHPVKTLGDEVFI